MCKFNSFQSYYYFHSIRKSTLSIQWKQYKHCQHDSCIRESFPHARTYHGSWHPQSVKNSRRQEHYSDIQEHHSNVHHWSIPLVIQAKATVHSVKPNLSTNNRCTDSTNLPQLHSIFTHTVRTKTKPLPLKLSETKGWQGPQLAFREKRWLSAFVRCACDTYVLLLYHTVPHGIDKQPTTRQQAWDNNNKANEARFSTK